MQMAATKKTLSAKKQPRVAASTRKLTTRKVTQESTKVKVNVKRESQPSFFSKVLANQSQLSFILGAIVVAIFSILLFRYFERPKEVPQQTNQPTVQQDANTTTSPDGSILSNNTNGERIYTVKAGDSLWSIAENELKDGYKWQQIAQANNLTNPSILVAGTTLTLPAPEQTIASAATPIPDQTPPVDPNQPQVASHTVAAGETLWAISVKYYNDGYMWSKIAQANNLTNPDLIHSGNVLTIPPKS